jgi:hypothetical protein
LFVFRALVVAWATLAIYYSNLPWPEARLGLAVVFAAFAVWALWLSPRRRDRVAFILVFAGVVAWWIAIPPSHDRNWRQEVAGMPRAFIDGDRVRITGCATSSTAAGTISRCVTKSASCRSHT